MEVSLPNFHVILLNATKCTTKLDNKIKQSKPEQSVNKVRDYKDGFGLQLIKFNFLTGGQLPFRVKL